MWWQGVKQVLYSTIITSQSFSELVPLDCDLHKCLSVVALLGETERIERAAVGYFHSSNQLGSGKIVFLEGSPC